MQVNFQENKFAISLKNGQRSFTSEKWKVRLSYWTLNMVFYFEESHYIPLQMKIAIWLQTKISQSLYRIEDFLTFQANATVYRFHHCSPLFIISIHNS